MRSWTYSELKTKVLNDLDLEDELFIVAAEMLGYFNEAIDEAEAIVHTLYEDYYLTPAYIVLANGTQDYSFPSDIYGMKVRAISYVNGATKYEIVRWRRPLAELSLVDSQEDYQYLPINTSASGYKIRLVPASREVSTTNVTIWYIRNAKVLALAADVCDLPELAINFVLQFVKQRCYEKEGHPNAVKAMQDTDRLKKDMIDTLMSMTDDENNEIRKDISFYQDFDSDCLW